MDGICSLDDSLRLDGAIAWFIKVFSLFILDTRITARVSKLLMSLLLETIQSHENQAAQHDQPANFSPQAIENQPSPSIILPLWV